jgi:hypothetical protein
MKQRDLWDETADEIVNEWISKIPMPIRNRVLPPSQAAEIKDEIDWLQKMNTSLINSIANLHTIVKAKDAQHLRVIRGIKRAITDEDYTVAWLLCEATLRQEVMS